MNMERNEYAHYLDYGDGFIGHEHVKIYHTAWFKYV